MTARDLATRVEAVLFTSSHLQTVRALAEGLGVMQSQIDEALRLLENDYASRGVRLLRKGDEVMLVTAPELAGTVTGFYRREARETLTRAGLETLAIILHREPITRAEIEEIRGVGSERILRTLLMRGLIREAGRSDALGRPILYATTIELLRHFGVERPEAIPPLPDATLFDESPEPATPPLIGES
jgi:segregation and condensation protein B